MTAATSTLLGDERLPERFWRRVVVDERSGCWRWTGSLTAYGYGQYDPRQRPSSAHRFAYLHLLGDPGELQLDHLCRNRACCNPSHLEPVTNRENSLRSPHRGAKTHCSRGHEFTAANTKWRAGEWAHRVRRCATCDAARNRGSSRTES